MKKEDALMGLEETGKIIWSDTILYGDWVLTTLRMLEILAEEQRSLSDIVNTFPEYYMQKVMYPCPEHLKQVVLTRVLEEWRKRKEEVKIITMDGIRINYSDGSWMLFRPSGTEPVFRVYTESTEAKRAEELSRIGSKIFHESFRELR
jgi:phosphomannomutase/phosphoglucomutase